MFPIDDIVNHFQITGTMSVFWSIIAKARGFKQ